jgi:hypothetical protein
MPPGKQAFGPFGAEEFPADEKSQDLLGMVKTTWR